MAITFHNLSHSNCYNDFEIIIRKMKDILLLRDCLQGHEEEVYEFILRNLMRRLKVLQWVEKTTTGFSVFLF
jgi:hypothetical protein